MKKLNLLLIFSLLTSYTFSQNFEKEFKKAAEYKESGDLLETVKTLRNCLMQDSANTETNIELAKAYALMNRRDSAFHFLEKGLLADSSAQILVEPDFIEVSETEIWKNIENKQIAKIEAKHGKFKNLELSKELWQMRLKDQAYYYHLNIAEKQNGHQSPIIQALWSLKHRINEKNLNRLIEIIDENGWPKKSVVKPLAASSVFLVIQHADIKTQEKYLPIMKIAADEGEAEWSDLALLIDRVKMRNGEKQIYGSQISINSKGEPSLYPIEEPENVNKRREEVGLEPLQDYISIWGLEFNVDQNE